MTHDLALGPKDSAKTMHCACKRPHGSEAGSKPHDLAAPQRDVAARTCASLPSILNQSLLVMSLTSKGWCELHTRCFILNISGDSGLKVTYWLPSALTGLVGIDGRSSGRRLPQQLSTAPILPRAPLRHGLCRQVEGAPVRISWGRAREAQAAAPSKDRVPRGTTRYGLAAWNSREQAAQAHP
jgi:hypothetical protein